MLISRWNVWRPLACLLVVGCVANITAADPPSQRIAPKDRPLDYWVDQLASERYHRREVATRQLTEGGNKAVPILLESISTGDLEATERAIGVLTKIALEQAPDDESGAWEALNDLATLGTASRSARAKSAVGQVWRVRANQAREALSLAGIQIGMDDFAIGPLTSQVYLIRMDDNWSGNTEVLSWLRWLRDVHYGSIEGKAIQREVLSAVASMPEIQTIALVDGELDLQTLAPLGSIKKLDSLEIRYIRLEPEVVDAVEKLPIRESLNLMGTAVNKERVALLREQLPGLEISFRQGGFLGVTCSTFGVADCRIRTVFQGSAAEGAGLRANDVIIGIDDALVEQFSDLQQVINQHLPGDEITIRYLRQGERREVKLKLGKYQNQ